MKKSNLAPQCGRAVQPKYGGYLQHFTAQDVAYFRDMPFSLSIPSHGVLVAHAGIIPGKPLEQQLLTDMLNVRSRLAASLGVMWAILLLREPSHGHLQHGGAS